MRVALLVASLSLAALAMFATPTATAALLPNAAACDHWSDNNPACVDVQGDGCAHGGVDVYVYVLNEKETQCLPPAST